MTFAFSTIIFATVFQSKIVAFLSKESRYADISTMKEIEKSDRLIQSGEFTFDYLFYIGNMNLSWVEKRLVDSFKFSFEQLVRFHTLGLLFHKYPAQNKSILAQEFNHSSASLRSLIEQIHRALSKDIFILFIPYRLLKHENVNIKNPYSADFYNFHRVEECVLSYPSDTFMVKNEFYGDRINHIIIHLIDAGIIQKIYDDILTESSMKFQEREDEDVVRILNMIDLQLAFLNLVVGLFLSAFVFVGEVFVSILKLPTYSR